MSLITSGKMNGDILCFHVCVFLLLKLQKCFVDDKTDFPSAWREEMMSGFIFLGGLFL